MGDSGSFRLAKKAQRVAQISVRRRSVMFGHGGVSTIAAGVCNA